MQQEFQNFLDEYSFDLRQNNKIAILGGNAKKSNPVWAYFESQLVNKIANQPFVADLDLKVNGKIGNSGHWLNIPYIRVFDQDKAPTAQEGLYIVYLFASDGSAIYLTLDLGGAGYNHVTMSIEELRVKAAQIQALIGDKKGFSTSMPAGSIGTDNTAKAYEAGVSIFKKYKKGSLPTDDQMLEDLKNICEIYREVLSKLNNDTPPSVIEEEKEEEVPVMNYPKNLIFYGAPGTGKTYHTVDQAVAIHQKKSLEEIGQMDRDELTKTYRDLVDRGFITFITFHQSYSYEDFIMGIVPRLANTQTTEDGDEGKNLQYVRKDGIFYSICEKAMQDQDHNYVLIIDEINRGNISKIFGELITLIEPSKRAGETEATTVRLPGLDSENLINFSVPSNVYIIGTMNTADRSIQHVDTALRRRFVFKEMVPDTSLFKDVDITVGTKTLNIKALLERINLRIKRYFDREHVIGHAPFMGLRNPDLNDNQRLELLGNIFAEQIIPLLQDYFFEDYTKIQRVLNEEGDDILDGIKLIHKTPEDLYDDDDGGHEVYEVAPYGDSAYYNIETYLQMVK